MADEPRILRQRLEEGFDTDGRAFARIAVEFKVGDDGPFTKRFALDGFSGADVKAQLDAFARELRIARGEPY